MRKRKNRKLSLSEDDLILLNGESLPEHKKHCSSCELCESFLVVGDNKVYMIDFKKIDISPISRELPEVLPENLFRGDGPEELNEEIFLYMKMKCISDQQIRSFFKLERHAFDNWKKDTFEDYDIINGAKATLNYWDLEDELLDTFVRFILPKFKEKYHDILV